MAYFNCLHHLEIFSEMCVDAWETAICTSASGLSQILCTMYLSGFNRKPDFANVKNRSNAPLKGLYLCLCFSLSR